MKFTVDPMHILQWWTWDHRSLVALVLFFALPEAKGAVVRFWNWVAAAPKKPDDQADAA